MKIKRLIIGLVIFDITVVLGILAWNIWGSASSTMLAFDGQRALQDVVNQVEFGPRVPGSPAHKQTIDYIQNELKLAGWNSKVLEQQINGHTAYNILATRNKEPSVILLGAHYDSRIRADNDTTPANQILPVPGANDGASGVAVLLEISRTLPLDSTSCALLFIDIEDNGNLPGWDWIQGSTVFAANLPIQPKAVVIIDMIGDADLNIYMEKNSDSELTSQIWQTAKKLGYESTFIPEYKYRVLDDHVPFIDKGLRAVDIIDLDYKYWHTIQDTADKVSKTSLEKVGRTLLTWIINYGPCLNQKNCNEK
jgi:hypothetical protein